MALLSPQLAIMSVGMSCQVAYQLREQAPAIAALAGVALEVHATPFDWIICGPAGVATMLADGVTLPRDPCELEARHKPYWPARCCWFWHVKGAITDHANGLARAIQCEGRLEMVHQAQRRIFFLANTQRNLVEQSKSFGGFSVPLCAGDVEGLASALQARFGAHELYVVTHAGKHDMGGRPGVFEFAPGGGQWQGDRKQWGRIFAAVIAGEVAAFG